MATKTRTGSKLLAALKSRFSSPAAALRALGLDNQDLLAPSTGGGSNDPVQKLRTAIEGLIKPLGLSEGSTKLLLQTLDEFCPSPDERLPDDDEYAGEVRAITGDVDEERVEKFRALLRGKLSDAEIDQALAIAAGANGEAKDRLPVNAIFGGLGGRRSDRFRSPQELAGDERRADYNRRFPSAIVPGFDYSPDRDRSRPRSRSAAPSERAIEAYNKRFGGEHIVNG